MPVWPKPIRGISRAPPNIACRTFCGRWRWVRGAQVLDSCCGHGIVTGGLLAAGAQVTALDFSPAMLEMARKRAPGAVFVQGDAMALPFADAAFETIQCHWTVNDPAAPFDYFHDGTARGGSLLRPQPVARKTAIREAVGDAVRAPYGPEGAWVVPLPAAMVAGVA